MLVAAAVGAHGSVVRDWPVWLTSAVAASAVLAALVQASRDARPSPSRQRLASLTELASVIALIPVLTWATGLYDWIRMA